MTTTKYQWFASPVTRPDAGGELYGVVRFENNEPIEADVTPSYDRAAVQRYADRLNGFTKCRVCLGRGRVANGVHALRKCRACDGTGKQSLEGEKMVSHPNRGKRKEGSNPKPEQVRAFRRAHNLSAQGAADLVFTSARAWLQWEAEAGTPDARRMHPQTFELANIKQRLNEGGTVTLAFVRSIWEGVTETA